MRRRLGARLQRAWVSGRTARFAGRKSRLHAFPPAEVQTTERGAVGGTPLPMMLTALTILPSNSAASARATACSITRVRVERSCQSVNTRRSTASSMPLLFAPAVNPGATASVARRCRATNATQEPAGDSEDDGKVVLRGSSLEHQRGKGEEGEAAPPSGPWALLLHHGLVRRGEEAEETEVAGRRHAPTAEPSEKGIIDGIERPGEGHLPRRVPQLVAKKAVGLHKQKACKAVGLGIPHGHRRDNRVGRPTCE